MTITLKETNRIFEESFENVILEIVADNEVVGHASVIVDEKSAYIERIDISADCRGKGVGTRAVKMIAKMSDTVYAAPDNDDSKRFFERIGEEFHDGEAEYVDQGFGVYMV